MIARHDEFGIYTNLSRAFEKRPTAFVEAGESANDDFRRHGLAWMAALARLELGAIAAGFSNDKAPFELTRPSQYELPAYVELLSDAMKSHYLALKAEPITQDFKRAGLTERQALTYVRRVHVATEMLRAFRRGAKAQLTPAQIQQLKDWEKDLVGWQQTLLFDVLKVGPLLFHFTHSTTKVQNVEQIAVTAQELANAPAGLQIFHCPQCFLNEINTMLKSGKMQVVPQE